MDGTVNPILDYWYFHLPNYVLAAVIYTLFGRFLLSLFMPPTSTNYIWRFFCRLTDPVLRVVDLITPKFVVPVLLPLVAAFWLYVIRWVFFMVMFMNGLTPSLVSGAGVAG